MMDMRLDKTSTRVILLAGGIVILIIFGLVMSRETRKEETPKPTDSSVQVESAAEVTITSKGFMPATLKVKKGTLIKFVNKDSKPHRPASDPHPTNDALPGFDSQTNLKKGQTYSFFFDKKGTFTYHDHLNPLKFKGTIVVE